VASLSLDLYRSKIDSSRHFPRVIEHPSLRGQRVLSSGYIEVTGPGSSSAKRSSAQAPALQPTRDPLIGSGFGGKCRRITRSVAVSWKRTLAGEGVSSRNSSRALIHDDACLLGVSGIY
jgi:hypothetical protein